MGSSQIDPRVASSSASNINTSPVITVNVPEPIAQLQAILETTVDPIITIDEHGTIERFNRAAEQVFGYTAEEVLGKNIQLLIPDPYAQQHREAMERYLATGERRVIGRGREAEARRKNGELFPVELAVSEVRFGDRRLFTGIVRDITQRKLYESELEAAKQAAEVASLTKSEFLANMSHEIRTPMTAIMGYLELIVEEIDDRAQVIEHVATVRRNADHLLRILNDILDLAKIESGKMSTELVRCSPLEIVEDVRKLFEVRALEKQLTLSVEYTSPVPQLIYSDPTRLRQVLMNLLGNALKFTDRGSITIEVGMQPAVDFQPPRLSVTVRDTGIGMTASELEAIFEPFTQVDMSLRRRHGGTGLGLTISRRIARMLGGDLRATSKSGYGSSFEVTVATGAIHDVLLVHPHLPKHFNAHGAESNNALAGAAPSLTDTRILLAEDGPDNQRLVSFILRKMGAKVTIVENGQLAVEAALSARRRGEAYDLILMDMQMPVRDGYEATAELRRNEYVGPIVALTAHVMVGDREKCLAAGCDDYLTKPVERSRLVTTCRRWIDWARNASTRHSIVCHDVIAVD